MSNYLGVATVTATLQRLLQASVQTDVEGARVTTLCPENLGEGAPESGVNIFLYHLLSNPAFANGQVAGVQRRGEDSSHSQAALDLYYILSFYGNEGELEPQRLLGSVVRTFEDTGCLSPDILKDTIDNRAYPFLAASTLPEQSSAIRIERQDLEIEQLSSLWGSFFDASYLLSLAYKVTVVLLEGTVPARRALPVRDRYVGAVASTLQPTIEQVLCSGGRNRPILRDSTLLIRGKQLSTDGVQIKLGSYMLAPDSVAPNQLVFDLGKMPSEHLRAGVQGLQVVHPRSQPRTAFVERAAGKMPAKQAKRKREQDGLWVSSNMEAFVLRPTIVAVSVKRLQGSDDDPRSGSIDLQLDLAIGPESQVTLALNEQTTDKPAEYLFSGKPGPEPSDHIEIPFANIRPGNYLARVTIDGAESLLQIDIDPDSPTYEQYVAPLLKVA